MDNIQFGAFVAQLRKEQELTQKELADRLNVTDKAVSKWETGDSLT
ncbi:helix-turn-helix domain-containing protein [Lawsonibacter sp. JLR.KK007]